MHAGHARLRGASVYFALAAAGLFRQVVAQAAAVTGTVHDSAGAPVRFATVQVPGTFHVVYADRASGSYTLGGLPPGTVVVCTRGYRYHTQFDTLRLRAGERLTHPIVLAADPEGTEPYPTCSTRIRSIHVLHPDTARISISPPERDSVWLAALTHYTVSSQATEADHLMVAGRLTGTAAGPLGPARFVLLTTRPDSESAYSEPFLAAASQLESSVALCHESEPSRCPQDYLTNFIALAQPRRLKADTMEVGIAETALNPADCRRGRGFVGFGGDNLIVVRAAVGWAVAGRGWEMQLAGSGFCTPRGKR